MLPSLSRSNLLNASPNKLAPAYGGIPSYVAKYDVN